MLVGLVAVPPQSVPPMDEGSKLFSKPWWLYFHNLAEGIFGGNAGGDLLGTYPDPIVVGIQGNPVDDSDPATSDVLTWDGVQWIPAPPSATPGAATIDNHVLTADANITASVMPAPVNGMLIVQLEQDSTGGWVPTWDPADFLVAPTSISMLPDTYTSVIFGAHAASGKWMMTAPPMTGRT